MVPRDLPALVLPLEKARPVPLQTHGPLVLLGVARPLILEADHREAADQVGTGKSANIPLS